MELLIVGVVLLFFLGHKKTTGAGVVTNPVTNTGGAKGTGSGTGSGTSTGKKENSVVDDVLSVFSSILGGIGGGSSKPAPPSNPTSPLPPGDVTNPVQGPPLPPTGQSPPESGSDVPAPPPPPDDSMVSNPSEGDGSGDDFIGPPVDPGTGVNPAASGRIRPVNVPTPKGLVPYSPFATASIVDHVNSVINS